MTATLVDSSVLLDVLTDDAIWSEWSRAALAAARSDGAVVINAIVYAEVSVGFNAQAEIDAALPPGLFLREALPWEAAFLAGKAFLAYRRAGGAKTSPLPDFYIGAHAAVRGHRLLTRDPRRVAAYFPGVELLTLA
jgi:predicted nucleic acid-binding protein